MVWTEAAKQNVCVGNRWLGATAPVARGTRLRAGGTGADLQEVAGIQIGQLRSRMAGGEFRLQVSDSALERLAELGFDPVYGARPLKRAVQKELENPLAQGILSGEFKAGDCIVIDFEGESFSFRSPVVSEAQVA